MGAGGLRRLVELPQTAKPCPFLGRKVGADVRTVVVDELAPIPDGQALTGGLREVPLPQLVAKPDEMFWNDVGPWGYRGWSGAGLDPDIYGWG